MNTTTRSIPMFQGGIFAAASTLFLLGLTSVSCGKTEETIDDIDSRVTCNEYCTKKADCNDEEATDDEDDACVSACRDAIEDDCGNEHQARANDKIAQCVDMACPEFWGCMVYDAAPACFGFVDD